MSYNRHKNKTQSTFYTPDKVANARRNIEQYAWAARLRDKSVEEAEPILAAEDDWLWHLVTGQSVPRSLGVLLRYRQRLKGSPGPDGMAIQAFGNYPWLVDPVNHPWKIQSPVTGELYPSNDFHSYYVSGLNAQGQFDREQARRNGAQFLTN